jgi:hypothetical protein
LGRAQKDQLEKLVKLDYLARRQCLFEENTNISEIAYNAYSYLG